jgi:hypothetical protein
MGEAWYNGPTAWWTLAILFILTTLPAGVHASMHDGKTTRPLLVLMIGGMVGFFATLHYIGYFIKPKRNTSSEGAKFRAMV